MKPVPIVPGVYQLSFGFVSAYLIDDPEGELTLIDSGIPGSEKGILDALGHLNRQPADLRHILITHLHGDHTGAAKTLQDATGARLYMHPADAADYRQGVTMRQHKESSGLVNKVFAGLVAHPSALEPGKAARVDDVLADGQTLAFAGGLKVIHTPGHTAGHVVFLYPKEGGVLFGGDACSNFTRLGQSMLYENTREAMDSLERIARLPFATACLSHGRVIRGGASQVFRQRWMA